MASAGAARGTVRRGPAVLITAALALLAGLVIASALARPTPPTFPPTGAPVPDSAGALRFTIDARDPDAWRFLSLAAGRLVPPHLDWDIAFRRFRVVTNGGPGFTGAAAAADLGPASIDTIRDLQRAKFLTSEPDSSHATLGEWYRYGMTSHILSPRGHAFAIRAMSGAVFLLEFAGYYCPGAVPGCVTIRYRPLDARAGGPADSAGRR